MVENTHALRSIRMEGLQRFCKQNKEFCVQKERMDGKTLTNKAKWFKILLSIFDLASCFFILGFALKYLFFLRIVNFRVRFI